VLQFDNNSEKLFSEVDAGTSGELDQRVYYTGIFLPHPLRLHIYIPLPSPLTVMIVPAHLLLSLLPTAVVPMYLGGRGGGAGEGLRY